MLKQLGIAAVVLTAASAPGLASTIDLVSVSGQWQNIVGGDDVNYPVVPAGQTEVRWGDPAGSGQSGYNFTAAAVPQNGLAPETEFDLGSFTHLNFPIFAGTSITAAQLKVDFSLAIPSGSATTDYSALFQIKHNETPNGDRPCANGGPNNSGVNINGCADSVTISTLFGSSSSVKIGDETYFLTITGFGIGGDLTFWTTENQANTINLVAKFISEKDIPGPAPIPLPAAGVLLLGALGSLGAVARRRRKES